MEKKDIVRQFSAGLFFLASIALIVVFVFTIGSQRGLTEKKFKMTAVFQNVGGLGAGAPVTLSGVRVGLVDDVGFLENSVDGRTVKVTMSLFEKYRPQLKQSVKVSIITEGVLGEKIVDITTDPGFYRKDLTQPVVGVDPLDVESLAEIFGDAAKSFLESSKTLNSATQEIKDISGTTKRLLNRIEQRIIDGNLFKVF